MELAAWKHWVLLIMLCLLTQVRALASGLDTLLPGEWYEIPNSKMSVVVPCLARNCAYSGVEGPGAVIWSWSGGVYDHTRDRLVVWGGGHGAYAGNEIYAFDMNALSWTRVTDPSNVDGYTNGPETYSDGRPVSVHSYDQIEYDPIADRMFVFGGSRYSSGSNTTAAFTFNFDSKQWTQVTSIPGDPYSETNGLSLNSAYDPVTKLVYIGGKWSLTTYNIATDTWKLLNKNYGGWELFDGTTAALDSKRRQFVQIGRGHVFIWDISATTPERTNLITSGAKEIEQCDAPGLEYDPVSDRIVGWCAGADVYTLNLDSKVWTKVTATNSVTPGDPRFVDPTYGLQYHGTFGRFRYVPSKNLFVVVTDMDNSVFVYKLADGAGQTPTTKLTLTVNAQAVDAGQPVTLAWEAFNADACTASGAWSGNKQTASNEVIASITSNRTFTLSCSYGNNAPVVKSVSVTVNGTVAPPTSDPDSVGAVFSNDTSSKAATRGTGVVDPYALCALLGLLALTYRRVRHAA